MKGHGQRYVTQQLGMPPPITQALSRYRIQLRDRGHVFAVTGGDVRLQRQAHKRYSKLSFIKTLIILFLYSINSLASTIYNTDVVRKRTVNLNSKMRRRKAGTFGRAIEIGRRYKNILALVASATCVGESTNGQIMSLATKRASIPRLRWRKAMPRAAERLH